MKPGVSIIICCHNSEKRISLVLDHLAKQVFYNEQVDWEIIIIDNASTDKTSEVAFLSWKGDPEKLRVLKEDNPGLSYARMHGINNAKFEYLSFIDDDNLVEENWIEKVYYILSKNSNVGICGGMGEALFDSIPPEWFEHYQHSYAVGPQSEERGILKKGLLYGAGSTFRKTAIDDVLNKGFQFILTGRKGKGMSSGDDYEFCLAIKMVGYDLFYEPELKFKHIINSNRLTEQYLTKLFSAFGRSFVIIELYKSVLHNYSILRYLRIRNRYINVLYGSYVILRRAIIFCIGYITFNNKAKQFRNKLYLSFAWNNFIERIKLFPKYNTLIQSIIKLNPKP